MSKKSERIERKAAATVKARHKGDDKPKPEAVAKVAKEPKAAKEGAMPALPKMPSASRPRKAKPFQPCACGCETPTRSTWAPGHDARAKGWALRVERGIVKLADVPTNERKGADYMLKLRKDVGTTGKITLHKGNKGEKSAPVTESVIPDEAVNQ